MQQLQQLGRQKAIAVGSSINCVSSVSGLHYMRDLLAQSKALLEMTSDRSIWRGRTQEDRLTEAYSEFARMCKDERVRFLTRYRHEYFLGLQLGAQGLITV